MSLLISTNFQLLSCILGSVQAEPNSVSCNSLKLQGQLNSGIYTLQNENQPPRLAFCDMTENGYLDAQIEKSIGYKIEAFPGVGRVMFSAARGGAGSGSEIISTGSDITYNQIWENVGDGLDITTGIFTCPVDGTYKFTFAASGYREGPDSAQVLLNGVHQFLIYSWIDGNYLSNLSHTWTFALKQNDIVNLRVSNGELYINFDARLTFTGYMILAE